MAEIGDGAAGTSAAVDETNTVREAVGVFHEWQDLQAAVDELLANGFDRSEMSLLAGERAVEEKLGHLYEKVSDLEDDPNVPRIAFIGRDSLTEAKTFAISGLGYVGAVAAVGTVVASGGTLAAVIGAAAAAGLGGAGIGSLISRALGRERAESLASQMRKGGLLLWVRLRDAEHEGRAVDILSRHRGADVHVHALPGNAEPDADPLAGWEIDPFLPRART
jgi:hypothetical protein